MLLLIIFGVLLVGGIIWVIFDEYTTCGVISLILGSIGLIICIILVLALPFDYKSTVIKYNQYIEYKKSVNTNAWTDHYNAKILYHREYCKNPWVGLYLSKNIAELELIPYILGNSIDNPVQITVEE